MHTRTLQLAIVGGVDVVGSPGFEVVLHGAIARSIVKGCRLQRCAYKKIEIRMGA